jgi:CubicO group peptidase (beta-lactamase class C family)
MTQACVEGTCLPRFEPVRKVFESAIRDGDELGASLSVDLDGVSVLDLWGGYRDAARTTPWTVDTIVNVWSTTKTVTALSALILIDRGLLDPDAPVARYWPEFAANGKGDVLVRHLLSHTSGVSGWDSPFAMEDMYDRDTATARLAAQAPWWEPGTACGYHASNFGHLIGELVRRLAGMTLTEFVDKEIAGPLGADFQIGARKEDWSRTAEIVPPPPLPFDLSAMDTDSVAYKTAVGPVVDPSGPNTEAWRRMENGANNGHGNAASVAKILSTISLGGGRDGVQLLRPDTIDLIFEQHADNIDLFLGIPLRWGLGLALPRTETVPSIPEDDRICFWGGWGGSMIVMDVGRRLTIAYAMNKMAPGIIGSDRSNRYIASVYDVLTTTGAPAS